MAFSSGQSVRLGKSDSLGVKLLNMENETPIHSSLL